MERLARWVVFALLLGVGLLTVGGFWLNGNGSRGEVIELRGATLPLLRLSELFGLGESMAGEGGILYVVVVGLAQNRLGVVVDGVIGQQDIVIKSLGKSLSRVSGIAGATNLASQQTILVLDVGALIEEALSRE